MAEAVNRARAALAYPDFRVFITLRFAATIGQLMQSVAVGWQVYGITHRPVDLGYLGLVLFLPQMVFSLIAGQVADRYERRAIMAICLGVEAVCALGLAAFSHWGGSSALPIFCIMTIFGTARAFLGPAMASLVPLLVTKEDFPNAIAWSSQIFQIAVVLGPSAGGLLYGFGPMTVYLCVGLMLAAATAAALAIRARLKTIPARDGSAVDRLLAGVRFVRSRPILLGAISLDLFAVLFGGATALLPVYAHDILLTGPWGLGILRSGPAIGAALCALWLAHHPLERNLGRMMFACVAGYGIATVVFGLSSLFGLSLAALIGMGAFDMVSVYVRQSLVQLGTPDAMRGRVSAVNLVFIGASNELGEFESGLTASWFGTVPAVVLGGVGTLAVVALWAWRFAPLRKVDRLGDVDPDRSAAA